MFSFVDLGFDRWCTAPASKSLAASGSRTAAVAGTNAAPTLSHSSPFYAYDTALTNAITKKWEKLLSRRLLWKTPAGKVIVQFHLNSDGSVSELKTPYNDVGAKLGRACEDAIKDSAPFGPWRRTW